LKLPRRTPFSGLGILVVALLLALPAGAGDKAPRLGDSPPEIDVTILQPAATGGPGGTGAPAGRSQSPERGLSENLADDSANRLRPGRTASGRRLSEDLEDAPGGASEAGVSLSWEEDLSGQVVVLDFWATWCPPCIASIPLLNELVDRFAEEPVRFISISYETEETVREFLEEHPLDTVVALDNDFATFKSFAAWGVPTSVLVSRKGTIAGVIHPEDLSEEVITDLLAGRIPAVKQAEAYPDPEGAEKLFRELREKSETSF
jgi:thiol-disulfide isomerase/thioredoxin